MLDPVVSLFLNGQIKNEDKSPDHTGGPVGCASVIPQSEKPPVQFPVRVHAWVAFEFLARVACFVLFCFVFLKEIWDNNSNCLIDCCE